MTIVLGMSAKVHRIAARIRTTWKALFTFAARIRNTWTTKYGLTFGAAPQLADFAGGNIPPTPLFADGEDVNLNHFEIYTSLEGIHTPEKRRIVEKVLTTLAKESIAHCMEALFRSDDDIDPALRHSDRHWSINPFNAA